ncbi:MAG: glycosyltransferase family 2 protein, partial [Candidatus Lokiarchaeota archaeon]|nr:glycosyltransferase family 2 protein [Candidatus Lokiarchaeota archaeon]
MNKEKNLPLVSICCSAYNHVNYIKDSIQGFIIQKTSFPFEILIHDDASTDGTTEIVKDYEHKYASLIKPIYQKDNQYSKGISPGNINRKRATGKYIAICEGDDYWTDPYKLQKQVDFLESNPEYGL